MDPRIRIDTKMAWIHNALLQRERTIAEIFKKKHLKSKVGMELLHANGRESSTPSPSSGEVVRRIEGERTGGGGGGGPRHPRGLHRRVVGPARRLGGRRLAAPGGGGGRRGRSCLLLLLLWLLRLREQLRGLRLKKEKY